METRAHQRLEIRQQDNRSKRTLFGYAAAFNVPTEIRDARGRHFVEVIRQGAFSRSLKDNPDVKLFRDHKPEIILGRAGVNLNVFEDNYGLGFECELDLERPESRSAHYDVEHRYLDGVSFGFDTIKDTWTQDKLPTRELRDVNLQEISLVACPAYKTGTTVDLRSIEWEKSLPTKLYKLKIGLMQRKNGY